ncbi:MAG TPA: hypothetical protein VNA15_10395 [Candidatus Angelobacter sp.]|nr:hypothetical protein [Candidatus Angelobacter sp.]
MIGVNAYSGAVEVRPFQTKKDTLEWLEAEGLPVEAMKRNPTTTVIPRVDESKLTLNPTKS